MDEVFKKISKLMGSGRMSGRVAAIGSYLKADGLYHIEFITKNGERLGGATIR